MKRKNVEDAKSISEEESSDTDEELEEEDQGELEEDTNSEDADDEDLAASDTESDAETSEEECEEEPKTRADIVKENVLQRYEERKGKQLFIRFPPKTANSEDLEEMAKKLSPLITNVHTPRQNYVRFCLVDFNSKEDRDATLKALRESIQKGDLPKYGVNIPRTESEAYVNELVERKIKSIENKKAKARLRKASKKALIKKIFTSTVVVLNLPKHASLIQIRELFPNAVDIQIKTGKGKMNKDTSIASITLPSTMDARTAVKKNLSLGGNQLIVKFDNHDLKKKKTKAPKEKKPIQNKCSGKVGKDEPESKKPKIDIQTKRLTNKKQMSVTT